MSPTHDVPFLTLPLLTALEQRAPHDRLCSIYEYSAEQFAVAMPFIDPDWMFRFWMDATAEARSQGFLARRVTGETEWVLRGARGLERWVEYERRLTHVLARLNCFASCQYKRQLVPPELILDILRTNPTVIYRGVVCRNMYHVPPEESAGPNQEAREADRLLTNTREREEVEHTLRQQCDALRESDVEAARRASEERWRLVFENSAIGIVLAEPWGTFVEANRAFQELVGYTNQELKTMTSADLTHEADISRGAEVIQQLTSGIQREAQIEKRYRHKDGRFIWVRATGTAIPGNDRSPRYLLGLVEDVTDRKTAEQELDASVRQLHTLAGRLMHAQDDERRRIARMLHETTAQDLAALKMHLARLNRTATGLSDADRNALAESIALADQSITEIRTMSYLLHPPFLDETGLVSALRWYAAGFAERSGIAVDLELPETFDRLPLDTETTLFRIVQESLINIHRHAGSATARIRLRRDAETLVLEIEDRGHGIPFAALRDIKGGGGGAGVGIAGMSERIEQLGGCFEIESSQGTTVRARLPLAKDAG